MGNLVIVAIPEEDDYVWKLSSEKVPHMTILSLGEQEPSPLLAQVESYLGHAVETMLHRFGMSVDRRDVLGPKDADVLLFNKSFCSQELKAFRDALLKNNNILDLYNDVVQYPDWVPHLTLGYPENPANPDPRDYPGVHWVNFDKIALWTEDFSGPEFRLKNFDHVDLVMSDLDDSVVQNRVISHAKSSGETLQDIIDGLSPKQRDLFDLVVGASLSNSVLPTDQGYEDTYSQMSTEAALALDFIVGAVNSDAFEFEHSATDIDGFIRLDEQLSDEDAEHFGVKGMKWGVRKDQSGGSGGSSHLPKTGKSEAKAARSSARAKVKAGTATLTDAHIAATKSTGHRVTNAFLGDKTYWKRAAIITGGTVAAVGASLAVPALLPAHILSGIAAHAGYTVIGGKAVVSTAAAGKGTAATVAGTKLVSASALGQQIATGVGLAATNVASGVAGAANSISNLGRAIRGNARVGESLAKLGDTAARHMSEGSKMTRRVLNQAGSIPKRKLRHEDLLDHLDLSQKLDSAKDAVTHADTMISTKPWSSYKKADYTIEQWHAACLIHDHTGPPESKNQCKLPVRTPTGTVNKNGVVAAAAALAGARGGVKATEEQITSAKKACIRLYGQMNMEPPESLMHDELVAFLESDPSDAFIEHIGALGYEVFSVEEATENDAVQFGIKGMKWGIRRRRGADGRVSGSPTGISEDAARALEARRKIGRKGNLSTLSNAELRLLKERIDLETNLKRATEESSKLDKAHSKLKKTLDLGQTLNRAIDFATSPAGQLVVDAVGGKQKGLKPHEALRLAKFGRDPETGAIRSLHSKGGGKKNKPNK